MGAVRPRWSGPETQREGNHHVTTSTQNPPRRPASHHLAKHGDKGTWYSVIPSRGYKQGDDAWKETDSLNFDDLLAMAKLLDLAHTWIMHQQQADAKARKESAQAAA